MGSNGVVIKALYFCCNMPLQELLVANVVGVVEGTGL